MDQITLQMKKLLLFTVCLPLTEPLAEHEPSLTKNSLKTVMALVEFQYRLFMYSSTDSDTLRPVVLLGKFKHVVGPSLPEEQRSRLRGDGHGLRQAGLL